MTEPYSVLVPLVNPNENESLLAQLAVKEGQQIKKGDLLAVFETTKSTFDLFSERDGFVLGIAAAEGELLKTGALLCYLSDQAGAVISQIEKAKPLTKSSEAPSGLRITQPALALAREHGIDLAQFTAGQLITEKDIRALLKRDLPEVDPKAVIIYGGGGHAKSLIDLIRGEGKYRIHGIIDDTLQPGSLVLDVPVLGDGSKLGELRSQGIGLAVNAVGGIGSITPRLKVYDRLAAAGFRCQSVVHPRAFVEPGASVGEGAQIFFNAYVGSEVRIGFGCIVNTGAILSHDCVLGDFVNISPGAILAGAVTVKERTLIGMGVTINLNVTIGAGARVGNSAVIKADVPENGIVRAGMIWPQD